MNTFPKSQTKHPNGFLIVAQIFVDFLRSHSSKKKQTFVLKVFLLFLKDDEAGGEGGEVETGHRSNTVFHIKPVSCNSLWDLARSKSATFVPSGANPFSFLLAALNYLRSSNKQSFFTFLCSILIFSFNRFHQKHLPFLCKKQYSSSTPQKIIRRTCS